MDAPVQPTPKHLVDWPLVRRRLRRPAPWIPVLAVVAALGWAASGYLLYAGPGPDRGPDPADGFRFDEVHILAREAHGNPADVTIHAWFSNVGRDDLHDVRLVVYATDARRGVADGMGSLEAGRLPVRTTHNGTLPLTLDASREYRIEILVLESGFLVARGHGYAAPAVLLAGVQAESAYRVADGAGTFTYEYLAHA